jgi:hypothetical protein
MVKKTPLPGTDPPHQVVNRLLAAFRALPPAGPKLKAFLQEVDLTQWLLEIENAKDTIARIVAEGRHQEFRTGKREMTPYRRLDGKIGRYCRDTVTAIPGNGAFNFSEFEILCRTKTGKWIMGHIDQCPQCSRFFDDDDYEISEDDAVDWLVCDGQDPRDPKLGLPAAFIADVLTKYDRLGESPRNQD